MDLPDNLSKIQPLFDKFIQGLKLKTAQSEFSDSLEPPQNTNDHLEVELDADFISFIQEFFRLYNLSVLHGEYCKITDVENLKQGIEEKTKTFTTEVKDLFVEYFPEKYPTTRIVCNDIEDASNRFIELSVKLHQKISNSKKTYLTLSSFDHDGDRGFWHFDDGDDDTLYSVLHYNKTLYELNISASIYDFSMEYVDFERIARILQRGISWIDGNSNTRLTLSNAIKIKCRFLSFKIMARIKVEDPNTDFSANDFHSYKIDDIEPFNLWSSHIKNHYEIISSKEDAIDRVRTAKAQLSEEYSALELREIHLLIKFYKDCSEEIHTEKFKKIHDAIKNRHDDLLKSEDKTKFDEFSYKFALNYVLNNQLSDIIKKNQGNGDETIHELYSNICKTQEETNIDNFFPHSKYLGYLLDKITSLIKGHNIFDTIDQIDPLLKRAKSVFTRYDKNVYWSQRKYNYIFHLLYDECFVDYKDEEEGDLKLFIASSITLPLRKEKYVQEFEENKKRLVNIERSIEVLQIVAKEHNELKDKSERLAREVKTKEIKYIEILSIFAAIIVFAAGSFTSLLNVARGIQFGELRGIILSIGLILFLFVALIFFISQVPFSKLWEQVKKNELQRWIIPLLVLVPLLGTIGVGIYYTGHHINQTYKETLVKQENIISKQDSVIAVQSLNIVKRDSVLSEQERLLNQFENQTRQRNSSEK